MFCPNKNNPNYQIKKAQYYWEHIVNIPCSTNLTEEQIFTTVNCLKEYKA